MLIKVSENKIFLHGQIFEGEELYFSHYFDQIDGKFPELEVHIHTRGGDVFTGNYIDNKLLNAKSKIHTINDGLAASMGGMMLISGDKVSMVDNGYIMLHAPSGTTRGNAEAHSNAANLLTEMQKDFIKRIVNRTGLSEAKAKKFLEGDNWFSADQAKKANLIDEIIPAKIKVDIKPGAKLELEQVYGSFAALLTPEAATTNKESFNQNNDEMKQLLITAFALTSVTAESSDTAIIEAIKAKHKTDTDAIQAKLATQTTALEALQKSVDDSIDAEITAILAPFTGKVEKETLEAYKTIGKTSGVEALKKVVTGLKPKTAAFDGIIPGDGNGPDAVLKGREAWDWDQWQKEAPKAIESLAVTHPETFKALYKAKFNKEYEN